MQTWPNFAQKSGTRHFETSVDAAFLPNARFETASQSVKCNVMTVYKQYGWLSISALSFENCIFLQIQVKKDRSMIAMYAKLTKCRPRMYYIGLQWIMSRFSFSSEHLEEFRHCNCFYRTQVSLGSDLWVLISVRPSHTMCRLNWCDSGWWG